MDSKTKDINTKESKTDLRAIRRTIMAEIGKLDMETENETHVFEPRIVLACHHFLLGSIPAGLCIICQTKGQTLFKIRTRGCEAAPAIICLTCGDAPTVRDSTAQLMYYAPLCAACDRECQMHTAASDQIFATCSEACSGKIIDQLMSEFQKELPDGVTAKKMKMCDMCCKMYSSLKRCSRCAVRDGPILQSRVPEGGLACAQKGLRPPIARRCTLVRFLTAARPQRHSRIPYNGTIIYSTPFKLRSRLYCVRSKVAGFMNPVFRGRGMNPLVSWMPCTARCDRSSPM
jgi:hypothetical protein